VAHRGAGQLAISSITRRDLLKLGLVSAAGVGIAAATGCGLQPSARSSPPPSATPPRRQVLPWPEADDIVSATALPTFPDVIFTVTDSLYGAIADGTTDNTASFKAAIKDCSSRGGGHVVVPAGVYATGAIHLLDNVDLHLAAGAVLRFNGNAAGYPLVLTRHAGIECMNYSPMVYAYGQSNIALTGQGVLDAEGTRAWNVGSDYTRLLEPLADQGVAPEQRIVPDRGRLRTAFVQPYHCTNVLIQGVTLRQAQFWQLNPTLCRNVTIDGVTTGETANLNTDGCNPECCDHVVIKNCTFDSADDCIAIKSGRDADGRRVNTPCQNIVIVSCTLSGPVGGIALGSEMTGGIRNVFVHDVQSYGTRMRYMLYVKSNTKRGGYAQNINFDSVRADHMSVAWAFAQMDYNAQTGSYPPVFGGWHLSRVSGDSDAQVLSLSGLSGNPISGVDVRDSTFTNVSAVDDYSNVVGITFDNVTINGARASS
jgi:polygalacturonase